MKEWHSFRYTIFNEEIRDISDHLDEIEEDEYDEYSFHYWIYLDSQKVGIFRLIPNIIGLGCMHLFDLGLIDSDTFEISRFGIFKDFRSSKYLTSGVVSELFALIQKEAKHEGCSSLVISVEKRLALLLKRSGVELSEVGISIRKTKPPRTCYMLKV